MALDPITAGVDLVTTVIDKIWPDKSDQDKQKLAAAVMIVQGQIDTNKIEAANPSMFVAGWRPFIGWVCGLALVYQYLVRPLAAWAFAIAGHPLPPMPGLDENLWELLAGMLGLGGLRSFEKVKGVAR